MDESPNIQERILALEERKVALEERDRSEKHQDRRGELFKTNVAAVLAFLTSLASLFIAYRSMQISESAEERRSELDGKRIDLESRRADAEAAQDERKWHKDLLDFTVEHRDLIFGTDELAKERISKIMLVTFPPDLVLSLFEKLEEVSPKTTAWKEGAQQAKALSPLRYLTAHNWRLRIVYGQNEDHNRPSINAPDDVTLKFAPSAEGYLVWRINDGVINGTGAKVAIVKTRRSGQFDITFTREDLGDPNSGVNCKRAYYGRGALFHLTFDSARRTLGGSVDVARPDAGNPPYKCADVQMLPL